LVALRETALRAEFRLIVNRTLGAVLH
jgi:hypothetical protein